MQSYLNYEKITFKNIISICVVIVNKFNRNKFKVHDISNDHCLLFYFSLIKLSLSFFLISSHNFVIKYSEINRFEEALQLTKRIMKAKKKIVDNENSNTLINIINLTFICETQNQDTKIVNLMQEYIDLRNWIIKIDHFETLFSIAILMK